MLNLKFQYAMYLNKYLFPYLNKCLQLPCNKAIGNANRLQ